VKEKWAPYVEQRYNLFNDLHALMACAGSKDFSRAEAYLASMRDYATYAFLLDRKQSVCCVCVSICLFFFHASVDALYRQWKQDPELTQSEVTHRAGLALGDAIGILFLRLVSLVFFFFLCRRRVYVCVSWICQSPLMASAVKFFEGKYAAVADSITDCRYRIVEIGGSNAQRYIKKASLSLPLSFGFYMILYFITCAITDRRDLFSQLLLQSAQLAGQQHRAEAIAWERVRFRPNSTLGWNWLRCEDDEHLFPFRLCLSASAGTFWPQKETPRAARRQQQRQARSSRIISRRSSSLAECCRVERNYSSMRLVPAQAINGFIYLFTLLAVLAGGGALLGFWSGCLC
jgi:hypothetical protein